MQSKSAIQISRARLCSVENIGTYCAASWYRSKSAEEKYLTVLYSGGIVTFVFVCHCTVHTYATGVWGTW